LCDSEILRVAFSYIHNVTGVVQVIKDNLKILTGIHGQQSRDVLANEEPRLHLFQDSDNLAPKAAPIVSHAATLPRDRIPLTGPAAANHIDRLQVTLAALAHVRKPLNLRPVVSEDGAGLRVDFYLPLAAHFRTVEAQVETANAGEQTAKGQHRISSVKEQPGGPLRRAGCSRPCSLAVQVRLDFGV
jgi:hypothetical protein